MATIQPGFQFTMRPAQLQAQRLQNLPDKTPYNEFVDATLRGCQGTGQNGDKCRGQRSGGR